MRPHHTRAEDAMWDCQADHFRSATCNRDVYHALDEWLMDTQIDTELMKKLSPLNLDVPLPYGQTVPPGVAASLALENSVMHSLWRPKPRLYEMVEVSMPRASIPSPQIMLTTPRSELGQFLRSSNTSFSSCQVPTEGM